MGLYKLVFKIGRMIFRDFLFKIPKKYLVVIIVFLSMFLLKSTVFGYSNYETFPVESVSTDLVFYKSAYINSGYIDTFIASPYVNGNNISTNYKFDVKFKVYVNQGEGFLFYTDTPSWGVGLESHLKRHTNYLELSYGGTTYNITTDYITGTYYRALVDISNVDNNTPYFQFYNGDTLINSGNFNRGNNNFNTNYDYTIKFGNGQGISYENFKIYRYENDMWILVYNFYPCKYIYTVNNSIEYLPRFL